MDTQISIGTLLTAAKILEGQFPLSALSSKAVNSATATTSFDLSQTETDLQQFFGGKIRIEKKHCLPSTSSPIYFDKKFTKSSRAAHNELEKNRRANLRTCLDQLKDLVPAFSDATRNTTLALLTRARDFIKELDMEKELLLAQKSIYDQQQQELLAELEQLRSSDVEVPSCSRPESREDTPISRASPSFLEYSPSNKPAPQSPTYDPIAEGLLPAIHMPIPYPRPSVTFPYFDLNTLKALHHLNFFAHQDILV